MNESLENMTEPSESLADVYTRWSSDTHIARIPTGFPTLDDACRGGLPVPWRIVVVGAPSAGKTALVMVVVRQFAQSGVVCGVLGVDEESDKLAVRAAQMLGFSVEQCEQRDAAALRDMVVAATGVDMRFYPPSTSIEAAAADVAARAADLGKHGVLAIDSIQTARCQRSLKEPALGAREIVEANMRAMTLVSREYRLLTVATSEANRGSYRTDDSAQVGDEIAAGKESGAIEYAAQTLLVLRTPRKHPDCVRVYVAKNRGGRRSRFEFFLALDRERHELAECDDPTTEDRIGAAIAAEERRVAATRAEVERNAGRIADLLRSQPNLGERELREEVR